MENKRIFKGNSLYLFPENYTVIDIETSGLSPESCEIIEISALKVRNFETADTFQQLIKPQYPISGFITQLTGISNTMVQNCPCIKDVLPDFSEFIGDDILMGYNVHFDINFLYDNMLKALGTPLTNDFVDVLRFSRKALPQLRHKSQTNVAEYFGISTKGAHRALNDCEICNQCYIRLKEMLI